MNTTIVVSVGRNIKGKPMRAARWRSFKLELIAACDGHGIIVQRPTTGEGSASQYGEWQGVVEDSAVVIVLVSSLVFADVLRTRVRVIGQAYEQDQVGFIVADGHECFA